MSTEGIGCQSRIHLLIVPDSLDGDVRPPFLAISLAPVVHLSRIGGQGSEWRYGEELWLRFVKRGLTVGSAPRNLGRFLLISFGVAVLAIAAVAGGVGIGRTALGERNFGSDLIFRL